MAVGDVERIVAQLGARSEVVLELDVIGEAVGDTPVTPGEIEQIFSILESQGKKIGGAQPAASHRLPSVLSAARELRKEFGRAPTVAQTAQRAGVSEVEVRKALLLVQVMQR